MNILEQEQYIFGSILLLSNKLQFVGDSLLEELTLKQWHLLMMISKMNVTKPTLNEVAHFTGTTRQNVRKMLSPLESKGFLRIEKSSTDNRAITIELTHRTFDYFIKYEQYAVDVTNTLFKDIHIQDLSATIRVLNQLGTNCDHIRKEEKTNEIK